MQSSHSYQWKVLHFLRNCGLHPLILCQCFQENNIEVQAQIWFQTPKQNEREAQGKGEPPDTKNKIKKIILKKKWASNQLVVRGAKRRLNVD